MTSSTTTTATTSATAAASGDFFKIAVEYGHFEYYLYWGCELRPSGDDGAASFELTVRRIDAAEPVVLSVPKSLLERLWARADKCAVWELPCSVYDNDLSDDIYHFGASVQLHHGAQFFNHKVPTGVVVRVPGFAPTKEQIVRFYDFVAGTVRDIEQVAKLNLPEYLWTKWESRRVEAKKLTAFPDAAAAAAALSGAAGKPQSE